MSVIKTVLGGLVGSLLPDRSYWAVKLTTGKWLSELDRRFEQRTGQLRPFDWTLDMVDNDDYLKIKELWLFCPPSPINPLGSTARLPIVEPATAFQFKIANVDAAGSWGRSVTSQIIGRIDDKGSGDCTYVVYDAPLRAMSTPMKTNIYRFGTWREGIAPIGAVSHAVLGLRLGYGTDSPHEPLK